MIHCREGYKLISERVGTLELYQKESKMSFDEVNQAKRMVMENESDT